MIDRYEWSQRTRYVPEEGRDVTWLEAQTDAGVTVRVELRPHPDEPGVPAPIIMVETPDGQTANSSRVEDWPLIETVLPRLEWPGEVWAGVDGPDPEDRHPDQAVVDAIADFHRDLNARADEGVDEVLAWLGDAAEDMSSEQLEMFREAATRIDDALVGEEKSDEREAAMIAALELICEETTLVQEAKDERRARFRYETAMARTQGAMIAADLLGAGVSQVAKETGFSRVTVYRRITPPGR
jgi:hypothetical protein